MTDAQLWRLFTVFWNWCRSYHLVFGEHAFSFSEMWLYGILFIGIVWFFKFLLED